MPLSPIVKTMLCTTSPATVTNSLLCIHWAPQISTCLWSCLPVTTSLCHTPQDFPQGPPKTPKTCKNHTKNALQLKFIPLGTMPWLNNCILTWSAPSQYPSPVTPQLKQFKPAHHCSPHLLPQRCPPMRMSPQSKLNRPHPRRRRVASSKPSHCRPNRGF